MAKEKIEIRVRKSWEVVHVRGGKKTVVAVAGSKTQAQGYAKGFEKEYGLQKKKKKRG